jgi:hypothetical protein
MARAISRRAEPTRIHFFPSLPGSRAVFLVEASTKKDMKRVRELFDMVGQLAEVTPISHGSVMSYAVQVHGDTSLFTKVEWLLKTQFTFSLLERSFSDVTFRLVRSLCEDSNTRVEELPECGICCAVDPFPTRATVELAGEEEPLHLSYCARCCAQHAEADSKRFARNLVRRDRRRLAVTASTPVVLMPQMTEEQPVEVSGWAAEAIAAVG